MGQNNKEQYLGCHIWKQIIKSQDINERLGMVMTTCSYQTQEAEAEGSLQVQGQPWAT